MSSAPLWMLLQLPWRLKTLSQTIILTVASRQRCPTVASRPHVAPRQRTCRVLPPSRGKRPSPLRSPRPGGASQSQLTLRLWSTCCSTCLHIPIATFANRPKSPRDPHAEQNPMAESRSLACDSTWTSLALCLLAYQEMCISCLAETRQLTMPSCSP